MLDFNKFNIVMLHGQESEGAVKDKAEIINLKALRNKGIDYLALGHIHAYKEAQLDPRGTYCYVGCLEGRGFDECGEHGFVVLDVNEKTGKYTHEFVPFAQRTLHTVNVDVTGCQTTAEMVSKATEELLKECPNNDSLVKIVLKGMLDVESEKDVDYFQSSFNSQYYFAKVYDETSLKINENDYLLDESLKGEYVRQVLADESLSEDEKKIIIRYGLQAIAGEEVQ
jgi:DNA repair exonuclease SbcCD nuclease subunit